MLYETGMCSVQPLVMGCAERLVALRQGKISTNDEDILAKRLSRLRSLRITILVWDIRLVMNVCIKAFCPWQAWMMECLNAR